MQLQNPNLHFQPFLHESDEIKSAKVHLESLYYQFRYYELVPAPAYWSEGGSV